MKDNCWNCEFAKDGHCVRRGNLKLRETEFVCSGHEKKVEQEQEEDFDEFN